MCFGFALCRGHGAPENIKHSPFLRNLDPYYVSRNVWNVKGILRRHVSESVVSVQTCALKSFRCLVVSYWKAFCGYYFDAV
jgi:hypothetical protein